MVERSDAILLKQFDVDARRPVLRRSGERRRRDDRLAKAYGRGEQSIRNIDEQTHNGRLSAASFFCGTAATQP
jgi:hypothetical protein